MDDAFPCLFRYELYVKLPGDDERSSILKVNLRNTSHTLPPDEIDKVTYAQDHLFMQKMSGDDIYNTVDELAMEMDSECVQSCWFRTVTLAVSILCLVITLAKTVLQPSTGETNIFVRCSERDSEITVQSHTNLSDEQCDRYRLAPITKE